MFKFQALGDTWHIASDAQNNDEKHVAVPVGTMMRNMLTKTGGNGAD